MALTPNQAIRVPDGVTAPDLPKLFRDAATDLEQLGAMRFASAADRTARLTGVPLKIGMLSFLQNVQRYEKWVARSSDLIPEWQRLDSFAGRAQVFPRPTATDTDEYALGSFASLISGTVANAEAGQYLFHVTLLMAAKVSSTVGNIRFLVSGLNISNDERWDLGSVAARINGLWLFGHGGGPLTFNCTHQTISQNGLILNNGSKVLVQYLGGSA